jgi:hypothetical protein
MEIFIETLITGIVAATGCVLTALGLRMYYGKNMTTQMWIWITPGATIFSMDAFIWVRLGYFHNILGTAICLPMASLIFLTNFILMSRFYITKLQNIADEITSSTTEMSSAALNVSSASRTQAEGTSAQAASIEASIRHLFLPYFPIFSARKARRGQMQIYV